MLSRLTESIRRRFPAEPLPAPPTGDELPEPATAPETTALRYRTTSQERERLAWFTNAALRFLAAYTALWCLTGIAVKAVYGGLAAPSAELGMAPGLPAPTQWIGALTEQLQLLSVEGVLAGLILLLALALLDVTGALVRHRPARFLLGAAILFWLVRWLTIYTKDAYFLWRFFDDMPLLLYLAIVHLCVRPWCPPAGFMRLLSITPPRLPRRS